LANYLVETTILVDYFRSKPPAITLLNKLYEEENLILVPTVVQAELYYGCRNEDEEQEISNFVEQGYISVVDLSEDVMRKAVELKRLYGKAHECNLVDMLIAASALVNSAVLITLNEKHFKMIAGLQYNVPYRATK